MSEEDFNAENIQRGLQKIMEIPVHSHALVSDDLTPEEIDEMIWRGEECANQFKGPNETNRKVLAMRPRNLNPGRNDLCWCGSGKKFKQCCIHLKRFHGTDA